MLSNLSNHLKRFRLPLFFLLSFIISWVIWIPQAAATLGISESTISLDSPLNLLAVWGPGLAAILLSILTTGKASLRDLLNPIRRWRVGIQWYIFVLFFPAGIWLVGRALDTLLGQSYELTSILSELGPEYAMMLPFFVIFALPSALGEEIGWRGFALPQLQASYNALVSSIIIGLFWGLWHIPTWIAQGQMGISLLVMLLSMVPAAILFTWVYNSTAGSLLLVWLFHAATAIKGYFLAPLPTLTDEILLYGVAVLIVSIAGPAHLSHRRNT